MNLKGKVKKAILLPLILATSIMLLFSGLFHSCEFVKNSNGSELITLHGNVSDATNKQPVTEAKVYLEDSVGEVIQELQTNPEGNFSFNIEIGKFFHLHTTSRGYFPSPRRKLIIHEQENASLISFVMQPMPETGELKSLDFMNAFIHKFDNRTKDGYLDSFVNVLNFTGDLLFEIGVHTDCRAMTEFNKKRSQARAEEIVSFLVDHGADPDRLFPKGYGESNLVVKCSCPDNDYTKDCTEEDHQQNRRFTYKILKDAPSNTEKPESEYVKKVDLDYGFTAKFERKEKFGDQFVLFSDLTLTRHEQNIYIDSTLLEYQFSDSLYPLVLKTGDDKFEILFEINNRPSRNYAKRFTVQGSKMTEKDELPIFISPPKDLNRNGVRTYAGYFGHFETFGENYSKTIYLPLLIYSVSDTGLYLDSTLTKKANTAIYGTFHGYSSSYEEEQSVSVIEKFEDYIDRIKR